MRLDLDAGCVRRGEDVVSLRPKALAVLRHLRERPGRLVGKDELLRAVWPGVHVSASVLRVCIREIRKALDDDAASPRFLETVPSRGCRWIGPVSTQREAAVPGGDPARGLVGRDAALGALRSLWARARSGDRAVAFVTGEAGIGKTALVDAFLTSAVAGDALIARGQCTELYGPGEPYLAVLEALGELGRGADGDRVVRELARHAPTWLAQMPALADTVDLDELRRRSSGGTHERMLREVADALETLARDRPIALVLEDLHWSDVSTIDLLGSLARRRAPARLLVIGTYRPVDAIVADHPIRVVKRELQRHDQCDELALSALREEDIAEYLDARFGTGLLPEELPRAIHRATDGNPLFMVDVLNELVSGRVIAADEDGSWRFCGDLLAVEETVPESFRELVERRVDRLPEIEVRVLEAASVVGESILAERVAAALGEPVARVDEIADSLARRGLLLRRSDSGVIADDPSIPAYEFLHALHRKVLYDRLPATRRARLHARIGEAIEAELGEQARAAAAELATHFARAGETGRALRYLTLAGESALSRFADPEAIGYFERALEIVTKAPAAHGGPARELDLLLRLGVPLVTARGFASAPVRGLYLRASELCLAVGTPRQMIPILVSLFTAHVTAGELDKARAVAEELDRRARAEEDPDVAALAGYALGFATFYRGDVAGGLRELERVIAGEGSARKETPADLLWIEPGVVCRAQVAWGLWVQGAPDAALERAREAVARARRISSPFNEALALLFLGATHLLRGEAEDAEHVGDDCLAVSEEYGFSYWRGAAKMCRGVALASRGLPAEGLARFRGGLGEWRAGGMATGLTLWLCLLAEALLASGDAVAAEEVSSEGLAIAEANGERWFEAELHRIRGEIAIARGRRGGAASVRRAIDLAAAQNATSLELRAVASLARQSADPVANAEADRRLAALREAIGEETAARILREPGTVPGRPPRATRKGARARR